MNAEVKKVLNDKFPKCGADGHRIEFRRFSEDLGFPEWSAISYGVHDGLIHFENEEDGKAWRECQKKIENEDGIVKDEKVKEYDINTNPGRCVEECGPIGFYCRKVA